MAGSGTVNPAIKANLEKVLAEAQRRMAQSALCPSFTLSQRSTPALGGHTTSAAARATPMEPEEQGLRPRLQGPDSQAPMNRW